MNYAVYIIIAIVVFVILLLHSLTKLGSNLSRQEELDAFNQLNAAESSQVDYSEFAETE